MLHISYLLIIFTSFQIFNENNVKCPNEKVLYDSAPPFIMLLCCYVCDTILYAHVDTYYGTSLFIEKVKKKNNKSQQK